MFQTLYAAIVNLIAAKSVLLCLDSTVNLFVPTAHEPRSIPQNISQTMPRRSPRETAPDDPTENLTEDAAPDDELSSADDDSWQSKSARKRQMHALQALGERLLGLTPGKLKTLPLTDNLREALAQYHRIRRGAREGRRRQSQLIGKLMRTEDTALIAQQLDSERNAHRAQGLTQQLAAEWRDRLASGPVTELQAFESEYGLGGDLRDLVLRARREVANDKPPEAQRLLYRRILRRLSE